MTRFTSSDPLLLLREDLRDFVGYRSARSEAVQGNVWLNANEATDGALRRYPAPQPPALVDALARLYGCEPTQLLVGRGSDEAIDLLVRAFCMPMRDAIVVTPPVFGMYAVAARLQGARVIESPLLDEREDFRVDLATLALDAKLVFLCSPGNPAGGVIPRDDVLDLARKLDGRALVVVDEAYMEFADAPSLLECIATQRNLVVLRTLSKAYALAGARIGCAVADPQVIDAMRRCQAPYPIPQTSVEVALAAVEADISVRVDATRQAREALRASLQQLPIVRRVYPSQTNFLLVRFNDVERAWLALLASGVVVRDMRAMPGLGDALRITIGTPEENARVAEALA